VRRTGPRAAPPAAARRGDGAAAPVVRRMPREVAGTSGISATFELRGDPLAPAAGFAPVRAPAQARPAVADRALLAEL
jgi:hypothetical protein